MRHSVAMADRGDGDGDRTGERAPVDAGVRSKRHDPDQSRRSFLRLRAPVVAEGAAPARLVPLPRKVFAHLPVLNAAKCTGCNVCTRVCPERAVLVACDTNGPYLDVCASSCTGCGVCVDVCDAGAIEIATSAPDEGARVRLREIRCRRCGHVGYAPVSTEGEGDLCRICAAPRRSLRQVRR